MNSDKLAASKIWVVDDDQSIRWVLERALNNINCDVRLFETASSALTYFKRSEKSEWPNLIITDLRMPGISGFELVKQIRNINANIPIIVMTAYSDLDTTVDAYREGAFEYLTKPFDLEETIILIKDILKNTWLEPVIPAAKVAMDEVIGESPAMKSIFRAVGKLSLSNENLLIQGEMGTGKSLLAKTIHMYSARKNEAFVAVNLTSIPSEALDRALFGNASEDSNEDPGFLGRANAGTLYLAGIEVLRPQLQHRLSDFLSSGRYYQTGSSDPRVADVRVIGSTSLPPQTAESSEFLNSHLYHRIGKIKLSMPALRERQQDISLLANYFFRKIAASQNAPLKKIDPGVFDHFQQLTWPGNILELKNSCESLYLLSAGEIISLADLLDNLTDSTPARQFESDDWLRPLRLWALQSLRQGETNLLSAAAPQFEKALLESALKVSGGRKQDAARLLGWGRNTLTRKLQSFAQDGPDLSQDSIT